jgi:curli biogenesis system outer membrane secretion channel CsgG
MHTSAARILLAVALAATPFAASAQPSWGAESSSAPSTSTSQKANQAADKAVYKPIEYQNASKAGPPLIVIPGEVKSNNANFTQKFGPNNIADFAEIELSKANFPVLERTNLGPLLNEFSLAYNLGDPQEAKKILGRGKLRTTKWVVKFDILKTEQVAAAQQGFDGRAIGNVLGAIGIFSGSRGGAAAGVAGGAAVGSVKTEDTTGVWIIGMRYKIMNAETTEQVATGYTEEKMEVGTTSTSVLGVSSGQQGGVSLDTMVQRLIQKTVWEIDSKYK